MTAVFLFRIKSKKDKDTILSELKSLIANDFDVDVLSQKSEMDCYLEYAYGDSKEKEPIKKAIRYLDENSLTGVIYVPCADALDESTELCPEEITVQDIFGRLYPSLSIEINMMYRIKSI